MLVPYFAGCYAISRRIRPKPHQQDLFAPRSTSMLQFCQPRAPHLTASLCEQPAQVSVPPLNLFFVLPTSSELCPRVYILESGLRDKRRGLLVLPSASCRATLWRSRPKPLQRRFRSALRQHVVHLPPSRPAFYLHRSVSSQRKSRYRLFEEPRISFMV